MERGDSELGHAILRSDSTTSDMDVDALSHAVGKAREYLGVTTSTTTDETHVDGEMEILSRNEVFPERVGALRTAEFYLDYLPFVRQIVASEDAQSPEDAERGLSRLRRGTRSRPGLHVRSVLLTDQETRALAKSGFTTAPAVVVE